ncbi:MAG: HD domain-containing protein [Promethearchaeota archaeon]
MKTRTGLEACKHILDPIHGIIPITPIELDVISTPVFQRLRQVSQLSLASLVFPGATHSRFSHSLGTMHILDQLLNTLDQEGHLGDLPNQEKKNFFQEFRLAALLHDCGHIPFSHTFENLIQEEEIQAPFHEFLGTQIITRSNIANILKEGASEKYDPTLIAGIISGNIPSVKASEDENYLNLLPLLHSDVDADRMDYLLRDSYFTGVRPGGIDLSRLIRFVRIHNNLVCFDEKAQPAVEHFLFSRFHMYRTVYIHKTVVSYDLLLHKIYDYMIKLNINKDSKNRFLLPSFDDVKNATEDWFNEHFCTLSEGSFFSEAAALSRNQSVDSELRSGLKKLLNAIRHRCAIKLAYRIDDIVELEKREYCEADHKALEELKSSNPEITEHWSFLHYDPIKPLKIASPISAPESNADEESQSKEVIRILVRKENKTRMLLGMNNSLIRKLGKHHRVLICYYHDEEAARQTINDVLSRIMNDNKKG